MAPGSAAAEQRSPLQPLCKLQGGLGRRRQQEAGGTHREAQGSYTRGGVRGQLGAAGCAPARQLAGLRAGASGGRCWGHAQGWRVAAPAAAALGTAARGKATYATRRRLSPDAPMARREERRQRKKGTDGKKAQELPALHQRRPPPPPRPPPPRPRKPGEVRRARGARGGVGGCKRTPGTRQSQSRRRAQAPPVPRCGAARR
jgi:hypothetical protein